MKKSTIISIVISLAVLVCGLFAVSMTASAALHEEGETYTSGAMYDISDDEHWIVSNNKWHQCVVDNTDDFSIVADLIRDGFENREDTMHFYIATNNELYKDITTDNSDNFYDDLFCVIVDTVYAQTDDPYEGYYLNEITDLSWYQTEDDGNGPLQGADTGYYYFRVQFSLSYSFTKAQEDLVKSALSTFNEYFIDKNPTIQSATGEIRDYLIVKTIYNFVVQNDSYDTDVWHGQYESDTERYLYSHSAYGALFGNIDKSYEEDFTMDDYVFDYYEDAQGLYRLSTKNQGLSVCDGYSQLFYLLCGLNGIECQIVDGDYYNDGYTYDPHEWNYVKLGDSWYQVDATFAERNTGKYVEQFTIVSYDYFLRGSEYSAFSEDNHQIPYDEEIVQTLSSSDYKFDVTDYYSLEDSYRLVARRSTSQINTSDDVIENYIIISPEDKYYKIVDDETISTDSIKGWEYAYVLEDSENFCFNSKLYYYSLTIIELAQGIEYTTEPVSIRSAGSYNITIYNCNSESIFTLGITVDPLDMGDMDTYGSSSKLPTSANFTGEELDFSCVIYDGSDTLLIEGTDYDLNCYLASDTSRSNPTTPYLPDDYVFVISYKGNYCNELTYSVTINKADLSNLKITPSSVGVTYSTDLSAGVQSFYFSATNSDNKIYIYQGTDYTISIVGTQNYGDTGYIRITAISSSVYLKAGSYYDLPYTINKRLDISSLFNGKSTGVSYTYSGSAYKPTSFTLVRVSNGKNITLTLGTDYKITGYANNVKAGTASVYIEFIGNYSGSATMYFTITCNQFVIGSVSDSTYTGSSVISKPSSVSCGGYTLKEGTDYTISGAGTDCGVYQAVITGKGSYAGITKSYVYFITPKKTTGVKVKSTTASSIKLSWSKQNNCSYQIYVYDSSKKKWRKIATTSATSFNVTKVYSNGKKVKLSAGKKYKFQIRAYYSSKVNSTTYTKYGEYASISAYTRPATPSIKKVTRKGKTITVNWGKVSSASGYVVYISTNKKFTKNFKKKTITKNTKKSYKFTGLKKNKTYYVRIISYKMINGKKVYSANYSSVVKVKTK